MGDKRREQRASEDEQPRCPVHWDGLAREGVSDTARRNAAWSHVDAAQAALMAQHAVEQRATDRNVDQIDTEFVSRVGRKLGYGHPLSDKTGTLEFTWTPEAEARLEQVPEFCREMTRWRVEWTAHKKNLGTTITPAIMETKFDMWGAASRAMEERHEDTIPWTASARARLARLPEFVRGQVIQAVEGNAQRHGLDCVDDACVDDTVARWTASGDFHEGKFGFR
ncbi:MAG: PCP reductase family protein [Candidatus Dormibacteraeota bacterium]|nr:PCP reductase family protein [Candidatus Dormibacteraeota bacterium]